MIWSNRRYSGPKSVQRRLIFLLVAVFIPLSLVLIFVYRFTELTLLNKVNEVNQFRMEQTSSRVQDLFQRIFMATNLFINDRQLLGALEVKDPFDIEKNKIYLEAIERLQYAFFLNEKYVVILRDNNGNIYQSDTSRLAIRKEELKGRVLSIMDWEDADIFDSFKWSTVDSQQINGEIASFIVFTRWLFNPETATKKGMISIVIPISYIQNILENDGGHYIIENEKNESVFSTHIDGEHSVEKISKSTNTRSVKKLNPTNWHLYQLESTDFLNNPLKLFTVVVFMTITLVIVIYIVIMIVVLQTTRNVFNQIRFLSKQLTTNSSNLSISIKSDYQIVELSEILRQLVHNLTTSRKNFELASIEKRKLEMQMLQQQMNPHFLLNTLSTIRFIADSTAQQRISSLVLSLSFLLRQQLYKDDSHWTMREENEYLLKYIEIQNARFGDEYQVDIHFQEGTLDKLILRMLIQPLLENCFEHAFAGKTEGRIQIGALVKKGGMELTVQDDGLGFVDRGVKKSRKNIGLSNVKDRLKLHYRGSSAFDISSYPSLGSCITIFIPDETS
ncbi:histidine kinase [Paenibacillus alba]|uniref:sensor histidine kinase n=1 Tax=Paenibacillus alba TaxID=1197127 RepID=UPI001563CE00|nr:histidine kinase [Paenibacillus alba]NQX67218.1 histidine kinase [Paenibacillus alba]